MKWNMAGLQERYFDWMVNIHGYKDKIKVLDVDFQRPWWYIIWRLKWMFGTLLVGQGLLNFYDSLAFLWMAQAIQDLDTNRLVWLIGIRLAGTVLINFIFYYNAIFQLTTIYSVKYSANAFFLEVDPIYHTTRSSGQIISKTNQGAESYESFLDVITFELLALVIQTVSVVVAMVQYDRYLAGVATLSFVIIGTVSVFGNIFNTNSFKGRRIAEEDKVSVLSVENLQQATYIRATFTAENQLKKFKTQIKTFTGIEGTGWRVDGYLHSITNALYLVSLFVLSVVTFSLIRSGQIQNVVGVGLIMVYHQSFSNIRNLGNMTKRLTRSYSRMRDLFEFIKGFGKQTYPVLEEE